MTVDRSPILVFCETALPAVFHQSPKDFLFYLDRDGNKFLQFYWEQVGKSFKMIDREDTYGLNYIIRKPAKNVTIAIVLLPAPQKVGEAYYEIFVYRPSRVTPILRISDTTSVFALTLASDPGGKIKTAIIERTRKEQSIDHGEGPEPVIEDFYLAVLEIIRDSRGNI